MYPARGCKLWKFLKSEVQLPAVQLIIQSFKRSSRKITHHYQAYTIWKFNRWRLFTEEFPAKMGGTSGFWGEISSPGALSPSHSTVRSTSSDVVMKNGELFAKTQCLDIRCWERSVRKMKVIHASTWQVKVMTGLMPTRDDWCLLLFRPTLCVAAHLDTLRSSHIVKSWWWSFRLVGWKLNGDMQCTSWIDKFFLQMYLNNQ